MKRREKPKVNDWAFFLRDEAGENRSGKALLGRN